MSSAWQLVLIRCKCEPRIIPILLAILRLAICFWPQTGYMHSDEFFQSSDVSAGYYFKSNTQQVWEFVTDQPIRCMLIPSLLNFIAFKLATLLQQKPSAYLLLIAPRLIYTLTSFIIDACLYQMCQCYSSRGLWYLPISIVFQSSFVCLGCLTRTFSNVPEVVIFSMLLVVVCRLIKPRFRILFVTPTRSQPAHEQVKKSTQWISSISIGLLTVLGTFNRPTFPCFSLIPLLYWLAESFRRNSHNVRLTVQRALVPLAVSAAISSFLLISYDTAYYRGFNTIKDPLDLAVRLQFKQAYWYILNHWVVTPYNFIRYNTNVENLSKYGLHSPYVHMLVNVPFAFSVLGLMFYGKLINLMAGSGVYRFLFNTHRVFALMLLTVLTSTILLSFIPHQEFRFLLPLIVPLVYVFAFNIYASNRWLTLWVMYNLIIIYFYSQVHQSGVIRAALDLDPILKSHQQTAANSTLVDVIALRCYLVPSYQWNIPNDDHRFRFHLQDTFEDFDRGIEVKLSSALDRQLEFEDHSLKHRVYFMLPELYVQHLREFLRDSFPRAIVELKSLKSYTAHFSGEEFQNSIEHLRKHGLRGLAKAFGFALMEADLRRDRLTNMDSLE